jgi:hypothetical protein
LVFLQIRGGMAYQVCRTKPTQIDLIPRENAVSRASRIPYHQNVYDLLGIEPGVSPAAKRMIAKHEKRHGPLPASVREWYLVPNVVPLRGSKAPYPAGEYGTLWFDNSFGDRPSSLEAVLKGFADARNYFEVYPFIQVLSERGFASVGSWLIKLTGSDDPQVFYDPEGTEYTDQWNEWCDTFSEFVALSICVPCWSETGPDQPRAEPILLTHRNGLWLRTPAEPFQSPVIDFLTDQFGEPERTPRPGHVTTYTFRPEGGTIRITADEPALTGGLSAWWIHAEARERLAEFARLLRVWGTLRQTLRADTEAARAVLQSTFG